MARFRNFILILSLTFLSGCTAVLGGKGSPQGNGEGFGGIISINNARVRCTYSDGKDSRQYLASCRAVTVTDSGDEILAGAIAPGVTLDWQAPKKIEGGEVSISGCQVAADGLSHTCSIALEAPVASKVQFDLVLKEEATQTEKTESDVLLLPFSAESFGRVAALLNFEEDGKEKLGLQNNSIPAADLVIGKVASLCVQGEKVFFSSRNLVYVFEKGNVRLYAGSANPMSRDFSHRLRYSFPVSSTAAGYQGNLLVGCGEKNIYVGSAEEGVIYTVREDGGLRSSRHAEFKHLKSMTVAPGDNLVLALGTMAKSFDPTTATLKEIAPSFGNNLTAIALAPDGSVYTIQDTLEPPVRRTDPSTGAVTRMEVNAHGPGLIVSRTGEIFFANHYDGTLLRVDPQGVVSTVTSGTPVEYTNADKLLRTVGMGQLPDGSILISEFQGYRIARVDKNGSVSGFAGFPKPYANPNIELDAVSAQFGRITGLAIGKDDSIYAADVTFNQVHRIDPSGKVGIFAGTGAAGFSGDGGSAKSAALNAPRDILINEEDFVFVADSLNKRIRRISPEGIIDTFAQSLFSTHHLAPGPQGEIFVSADAYSGPMGKVDRSGNFVRFPVAPNTSGLTVLGDGTIIYASNVRQHFIYRFDPATNVSTGIAGKKIGTTNYYGFTPDGQLTAGSPLYDPRSLKSDDEGNIYFAEAGSAKIRVLRPSPEGYRMDTLFGGASKPDCSGAIKRDLSRVGMENEIRVSLASLCYAKPVAFAIRNHCSADKSSGHITMAVAQDYGNTSNIIRIRRPCF